MTNPKCVTSFLRSMAFSCLTILVLHGCEKKAPASFERPPAPVTVAAAVAEDVPIYIDAVGKIVAREVVSIQPQVSGRITRVHFADGADVKAGEVLFTIDPRPFQAQLNQAEANVAQAQAALNLGQDQFRRGSKASATRARFRGRTSILRKMPLK